MKKLHEGPLRGHFTTEITQRKILDISGQLCIEMCTIIVNLVMHVKEQEGWQFKVLQSYKAGLKFSKGPIYEMGT